MTPCYNSHMGYNQSDDFLVAFGKNLERFRKSNGYSTRDLEYEGMGITRSYYQKAVKGKHAITIDKVFLLSKAFGVTPDQLFIDENGTPI